jgi:hypothetical protein
MLFVAAGAWFLVSMIAILVLGRPDTGEALKVGVGLVLSLWSLFRLSRCGIYADHEGVRVLNPLSSTRLRWDEIRRFILTERGGCRLERVHGSAVSVFGIQQPTFTLRRSSRSREAGMIDELNRRVDAARP